MGEASQNQQPSFEEGQQYTEEPIGDVVIGKTDPRTLTREQFNSSADLLFHGAKDEFQFQRDINYAKFSGPYSSTIGSGFYATDDRENAELYSRIRNNESDRIVVVAVLPYQARMFDLRAKKDPRVNAFVPAPLAHEYLQYIKEIMVEKYPSGYAPDITTRPLPLATHIHMSDMRYLSELFALFRAKKPIELRKMLSALGASTASEYGSKYFRNFMLQKGYDGLIYNEGGDRSDQTHTTSYVFYNPKKIGTYETWQQTME